MANIRIKDLANTANTSASDDFMALDGVANGTRKMSAFNPEFGGSIKVGNGTAAAPSYGFNSEAGLGFYRVAATGVGFGSSSSLSLAFYPGGEIYGAQGSNRISLTAGGAILLSASSSNQPITMTPSGAATAGGLSLTRLTSTNQTLALLNYGTDELMSIVGTGYTGIGSRSNTGFLLYSNNTERARFLAGGNFLIGTTVDSGAKLQVGTDTTAASGGMIFGTDVNLYRSAANTLKTDDVFQAAQGVSSGTYLGGQDLYLNNAAGTVRAVYWQTAGSSRWAMYANTTAEGGSNTGTNYVLSRYSDAGAYLGDPLSINRATGAVSLEGNLSLTNTATQVIFGQTGAAYTYTIRPIQAGGAIQIKQDPATINRWLALGGSDNSGNFSERMRIQNAGNILIGTTVDSSALLQVGTDTAALSGGMIFGTDAGLYRQAAGHLQFDHVGGANPQFKIATSGTTRAYLRADVSGNLVVNSTGAGSVYLAFDNGTGGVIFGNGAVGSVGGVTSVGNASFNGTLGIGGNFTIRKDQAANTSQFIDNRNTAGGEVVWFTEDGLSTEYAYIARYNSAHAVTGKRKALEFGVNGTGAFYSFATGVVKMDDTSGSTTTTSGALQIAGGLGVAGAANVGTYYGLVDGVTAPATTAGYAKIYVDTADGDLKIKFGDGTIKTIVTDT